MVGPESNMTGILRRKGERHGEADHVKTKAEVGVMLLQAKECLGLANAGRHKEGSPTPPQALENSKGAQSFQYLNFGLLAPRTVRE